MLKVNTADDLKKITDYYDEVLQLYNEAKTYVLSFKCCHSIRNSWIAYECGYIIGIFLFEVEVMGGEKDNQFFWVIVGDLPPVCISKEESSTAYKALLKYIFLMEDWISKVNMGENTTHCYPINVPCTKEYADMLQTRIDLLREDHLNMLA